MAISLHNGLRQSPDNRSATSCYGCPFLNVATEYPETDYLGHQVAIEHKQAVRVKFRQLAKEAGAASPDILADQLFLLARTWRRACLARRILPPIWLRLRKFWLTRLSDDFSYF